MSIGFRSQGSKFDILFVHRSKCHFNERAAWILDLPRYLLRDAGILDIILAVGQEIYCDPESTPLGFPYKRKPLRVCFGHEVTSCEIIYCILDVETGAT